MFTSAVIQETSCLLHIYLILARYQTDCLIFTSSIPTNLSLNSHFVVSLYPSLPSARGVTYMQLHGSNSGTKNKLQGTYEIMTEELYYRKVYSPKTTPKDKGECSKIAKKKKIIMSISALICYPKIGSICFLPSLSLV